MDLFYIIEALCKEIGIKFKKPNIYINNVPQGFKRPSFYVGLVDFADEDLSYGSLKRRSTFEIVYFAPVNERGACNKAEQYASYMSLCSILNSHSLAVGDRHIKIVSKNGNVTETEANLIVNFEYVIDGDVTGNEDMLDLLNELQMKYNQ